MGQLWFATHRAVPDEVKESIKPIEYTPCPVGDRQEGATTCEDCSSPFGYFCRSTNCDWCGRQLCTRCCPNRYLLSGAPACAGCTKKAYCLRRSAMLQEHMRGRGVTGQKVAAAAEVEGSVHHQV